jgi:hypothetical protein
MPFVRTAALVIGALAPVSVAADQAPPPPTIDCALGFAGLRAQAEALAGAAWSQAGGYDIATLAAPDAWRVQIAFTTPGHPAHPAVTIRTLRKQVTEVWTADSKGCGYGNQGQFAILMADMKSGDTELTNASRHEVEQRKQGLSPLGSSP